MSISAWVICFKVKPLLVVPTSGSYTCKPAWRPPPSKIDLSLTINKARGLTFEPISLSAYWRAPSPAASDTVMVNAPTAIAKLVRIVRAFALRRPRAARRAISKVFIQQLLQFRLVSKRFQCGQFYRLLRKFECRILRPGRRHGSR